MITAKFCRLGERKRQTIISSASKALSSASTSKEVNRIHSLIITWGLDQSVFFAGKLISKYAEFKHPIASLSVFDRITFSTNVYLWNSIIRALTQNGMYAKALDLYSEMQKLKICPDTFTFPSVINACAGLIDFEMGKLVHYHVLKMGFSSDLYIANALVDMYARFNELGKAHKVFHEMPHRDLVSWNSLISGYTSNGYWEEALEMYYELRIVGIIPDSFTFSSILPACGGLIAIIEGQLLHGLIEKIGFKMDILVSNGLLSMYCKFNRLQDGRKIFDENLAKDTVTWNTMICGYSQSRYFEESIQLFLYMKENKFESDRLTMTSILRACGHLRDIDLGRSVHDYMIRGSQDFDTSESNILINMYARCGDLSASQKVFDMMNCRDSVSWNSLIGGYIQNGCFDKGIDLLKLMNMELKWDSVTHVMLLSMSTELLNISCGMQLHCDIVKMGFDSDKPVSNALVDMYANCGKIENSLKVFQIMKARDTVTWNTIITGCIRSKDHSILGLRLVGQMRSEGVMPDGATMLGILPMSSFWHGKEMHGCIYKLGFESDVAIGNALIEMYFKCGSLKNSVLVFNCMKTKDVVTWTALISAYGSNGEGERALTAFADMEALGFVPDSIIFITVIFACSHSGLVSEGLTIFDRMKKEYHIEPEMEHYACVVDLLARSGLLAEAEEFICSMPVQPDASIWGALLSSCLASGENEIAERIFERVKELDADDGGYYVLVSNVYASLGKWNRVRATRKSMRIVGLRKDIGCSWMEIQRMLHHDETYHNYCAKESIS